MGGGSGLATISGRVQGVLLPAPTLASVSWFSTFGSAAGGAGTPGWAKAASGPIGGSSGGGNERPGRNPIIGPPRDCWDEIPEIIQLQIQDCVQASSLGYPIVLGWDNAAAVAGISVRALKRAVVKGRIPKLRTTDRGTRGCRICWPLSMLWDYRRWRELAHPDPVGAAGR